MATTMRVPTIFTAVDRFSGVVSRMSRSVSAFGETAQAASMRASRKMNDYGSSMLTAGAGMAVGIGLVIDQASKYETAIASLAAVTGTSVGSMNKDIESLGLETSRSVIDIAKGFETIGSKMSEYLKNPTALREIAKQSILLADASKMSIEDSTDNLTSILNQFKLSYKDANRVINKLSSGEDIGASTISESADVVRQFAASSRMAGASLEETIALVQTTTKTLGKDGVGRGFRNLMVDLNTGKGMDKNKQKALVMVGADINKIINPTTKFIDKLREVKKLLSNKQAMGMFFKKTGFETGATFLSSFKMFEDYLSFIEKNNTAQAKADKNNATFSKKLKDLKNTMIFLAIVIGQALLPLISKLVVKLIPIIKNLTIWAKENKRLIKAVFYLTIGLLAMGVVLKAGAFYLLGYSRALAIVNIATKAYTFSTMVMSFGLRGVTVVAYEAAIGLWATVWPMLALGLLIWVVIDMVQHWEDWNDIIMLLIGPLGWVVLLLEKISKHSDNISNKFAFEGWGSGIKAIGVMLEDLILSPLIGIFNIMGRLTSFIPGVGSSFKEMAVDLESVRDKVPSETSIGNATGSNQFSTFGGLMPQWNTNQSPNLAGSNMSSVESSLQDMLKIIEKGGVLELNLNAPPGVVGSVDNSKATGVKVNLGSTQGQRGNN
jgi:TP901 family phage tail tape measure protein